MPLLEGSEENPCVQLELGMSVWQFSSVCNLAELELECFLHWANFPCERHYVNQAAFSHTCLLWFYCISGRVLSVLLHFEINIFGKAILWVLLDRWFLFSTPYQVRNGILVKPYCSLRTQSWNTIKRTAEGQLVSSLPHHLQSGLFVIKENGSFVPNRLWEKSLCASSLKVDRSRTTSSVPGLTWCLLASAAIYDNFCWPSLVRENNCWHLPRMSHHILEGGC